MYISKAVLKHTVGEALSGQLCVCVTDPQLGAFLLETLQVLQVKGMHFIVLVLVHIKTLLCLIKH